MNTLAEIANQVRSLCGSIHQYHGMGTRQRKRIEARGFYSAFARSMFAGATPQVAGYVFNLVRLRSILGASILSVVPVKRGIRSTHKLQAFVGHRFTDAVTQNLRHNLAIVLKAYGIQPRYSDSDSPNGPVFQTILDRIRKCDFAIFDDRETEVRPNTLIEIGAATAMDKPHFYFNHENKRTIKIGLRREDHDCQLPERNALYAL
jgi:hypothetical protein